ncbi:MAG: hypothetical protein MJ245_05650, partial [Clostridia bacterium]|nr:hypothetical protein [Clostridia bacterium]
MIRDYIMKGKVNKKHLTKKDKKDRSMHSNFSSLIKSSVYVLTLLSLIMLTVICIPSKSYADGYKKYRYTFDFGTFQGKKYIYTIETSQPEKATSAGQIEITDKYVTGLKSNVMISSTEFDSLNLMDYMLDLYYDAENQDESASMFSNVEKMFLRFCCSALSSPAGDNRHWAIMADAKYGKFGKQYVRYISRTTTTVPTMFSGYYYGAASQSTAEDFKKCASNRSSERNPLEHINNFIDKGMYVLIVDSNENVVDETNYSLHKTFQNDRNLAFLASYNIDFENNSLGFKREEIKEDEAVVYSGEYSYEVLTDTIDKENATVDIAVKHSYDAPAGTMTNTVFKFRYTKGGMTNVGEDPKVNILATNDNTETYHASGYRVVTPIYGLNGSLAEEVAFPCIDIGIGIDRGYGFGTQLNLSTQSDVYYNKLDYKFVGDAQTLDMNYLGYVNAYAAVKSTRKINIINVYHGYTDLNSMPKLQQQNAGTSNVTENYQDAQTILQISMDQLDSLFPDDVETPAGDTLTCGNWTLTYVRDKNILVAYNHDLVDLEEQCYFIMDFTKGHFYKINTECFAISGDDLSFKLHLSKDEDKTSPNNYTFHPYTQTGQYGNRYAAVLVAKNNAKTSYNDASSILIQNMIDMVAVEESNSVLLRFYDMTKASENVNETGRGQSAADSAIMHLHYGEPVMVCNSSGSIVSFDITPWFKEMYKDEIKEARTEILQGGRSGGFGATYLSQRELDENQADFLHALMKYSKPIIMFLVLLAVIWTGIYSIIHNKDPKERVLVKEKLKHILVGVMLFAACVAILFLCKQLMDSAYMKIQEAEQQQVGLLMETPDPDYDTNWAVDLVTGLINVVAEIVDWMINSILTTVVGGTGTDLNYVIFNNGVEKENFDIAPFTVEEWSRYMYGYQALEALALALLAIAIVKMSVELIMHADNAEKKTEIKESCLRVAVAMLAIILGPYLVRILLLLFNYLISLVPVKSIRLDLSFGGDTGILGAIASLMFAWIKFKIYLVFVVRKLMITFMLLITPVVFGLWAISDKFRSLSLWIGELVTNSATQFCYALVFFIASLIMYENQSDFVTLIIVMMFMELADFFKDSLQGLVQKWGGIDEKGAANNLAGQLRGYANKGVNMVKGGINTAGGITQGVANFVDPDKVTEGGRVARNIGGLLQGNVWGWQTKSEKDKNVANLLQGKAKDSASDLKDFDNKANAGFYEKDGSIKTGMEGYADAYNRAREGNMTVEESGHLAETDSNYQMIHEMNQKRAEFSQYKEAESNMRGKSKNEKNWLDNAKSAAKDHVLDDYVERSEQQQEKTMKTYEEARDKLASQMASLNVSKEIVDSDQKRETLVKSCEAAFKKAEELEKASDKAGMGTKLSTDVKRQIADIAAKAGTGATSALSPQSQEAIRTMSQKAYDDKGQTNGQKLASISKQLTTLEEQEKKKFDESRNKREAMINKTLHR